MYRISVCVIRKIQDTVIHLLVIRIKQQQQFWGLIPQMFFFSIRTPAQLEWTGAPYSAAPNT